MLDPENFSREAEAKRPVNAWKPFGNGQRLHRPRLCDARSGARDRHDPAALRLIDINRYQMQLKKR
jgi:cytochrome P450/NADPH-cytochrome P450 reductase